MYKTIEELVTRVDERNSDGTVSELIGVSIDKCFIKSVANTNGTDLSKYKIIRKNDFAVSLMQVSRDGKIPVARLEKYEEAIMSPAYPIFRVKDKNIILPEYLEMWFKRPEFDREAAFIAVGGVLCSMPWEEFAKMKLPVPPIEKQRKIVNAYKIVTDRIALKQKINDNLEATASAMFKERFSIERANPEWLVGTLQDLYTFQYGKGNNNPDNGGVYPVYGSNGIIGGYDEYNNEDAPVIGHIGINCGSLVFALGKHFVTYNGVMCNVNNPKNKYFGYLTLANSRLQAHVRGSSQPFVSYDMLYEIKAVLPPSEVIEQFEKQVTPLFEQVSSNQREIKHLLELQTIQLARLAN
jgi:restriction endonuclease S subunit